MFCGRRREHSREAAYGQTDVAALLIAHGANVNAKDAHGYAPLHYAVYGRLTHRIWSLLTPLNTPISRPPSVPKIAAILTAGFRSFTGKIAKGVSMDANFWHQRWAKNEIAFHERAANPLLVKYFHALALAKGNGIIRVKCTCVGGAIWSRERGRGSHQRNTVYSAAPSLGIREASCFTGKRLPATHHLGDRRSSTTA